jgi:predicted Zn-dependent protease
VDGAELVFRLGREPHRWPLSELGVEQLGDRVRLSLADARLNVAAADWAALRASLHPRAIPSAWRREGRLVLILAAVAGVAAFVIFVGLPAISGPLARHTPPRLETQMGETFAAQLDPAFVPCKGEPGQAALAAFGQRLTEASHSPFRIRVRAVQAPIVNAFALPGGRVLVTGDLIDLAQTPDELAAVIAHEATHVKRRHVMQAVWRSLGLGVLLDAMVGGGTGAGQQAVLLAGSFTNLRYTRQAEAEADAGGQQLLHGLGLSSQGMAPFFERLAAKGEGRNAAAVNELLSDHPDTLRRARQSRLRAQPGRAAFSPQEWAAIKAVCKGTHGPLRQLPHFP